MFSADAAYRLLKENLQKKNDNYYKNILIRAEDEVKEAIANCRGMAKVHIGDLDSEHTDKLYDYMASLGYYVFYQEGRGTRYIYLVFGDDDGKELPASIKCVRRPALQNEEDLETNESQDFIDKEAEMRSLIGPEWDEQWRRK